VTIPIKIPFLGDSTDLKKATAEVDGALEQTATRSQKAGKIIDAGAKAAALGFLAAGAAALKLAQGAAEDEKAANALAKTLKNAAGATDAQVAATEDWITAQGKALGVADDQLRPALNSLAVATGDVGEAQKLAALAMDVSAGTGKSLEQVATALAKAQNGNVSALSRLGIKTKDSVKDEGALQAAQIATTKARDKYNKAVAEFGPASSEAALAADELEYRQTKLGEAQGKAKLTTIDFAEAQKRLSDAYGGQAKTGAETLEGKMNRLKLALSEAGESIGYMLIPALTKLGTWLNDKVVPALDATFSWMDSHQTTVKVIAVGVAALGAAFITASLAMKAYAVGSTIVTAASKAWAAVQWVLNAALSANPIGLAVLALGALAVGIGIAWAKSETFRDVVTGAFDKVKAVASGVADFFTEKIPAAFNKVTSAAGSVVGWVKSNWPTLLAILTGPIGLAVLAITKKWDDIKAGATAVKDWVTDKFNDLVTFATRLPARMSSALGGLFDGLRNTFLSAVNFVIDKWNSFELKIDLPKVLGGGSIEIGTPNIPHLATGGIVTRPTVALIGEAGPEAVVPLNGRYGGGNVYEITVMAPVGSSSADIGRDLVKHITAYERAGGRRYAT
jgi:hypothetical protein